MGPRARYIGSEVPEEELLWQDPVPAGEHPTILQKHQARIQLDGSGLTATELVHAAWASASTYRNTDKRGGANGARIALEPQKSWPVNAAVASTIEKLKEIQPTSGMSLADLIVFAGSYAIEEAANDGGMPATVEFTSGRGDATQEQTDVESFNHLYPVADAFVNWSHKKYADSLDRLLIDKATLLGLTPPEMVALYGGLRALGVSTNGHGILTKRAGHLTNDFFVNILDMDIEWEPIEGELYEGRDRKTKELLWTASRADLVFASNSILRAYAEVYASDDGHEKLVEAFISVWEKIMNNDRFDV